MILFLGLRICRRRQQLLNISKDVLCLVQRLFAEEITEKNNNNDINGKIEKEINRRDQIILYFILLLLLLYCYHIVDKLHIAQVQYNIIF